MAKQNINVGSTANDGTGDTLRVGGQTINAVINEIYDKLGDGTNLEINTSGATNNKILKFNSSTGEYESVDLEISVDTSPTLGGNLNVGTNEIITSGNDNLSLNPGGAGKVRIKNTYTLPNSDGTANQVLKTDGAGNLSFSTLATTIQLRDQDSSQHDYLIGGDLQFLGDNGITTSITGNVITHSIGSLTGVTINTTDNTITDATDGATKGIARFESSDFSVSNGAVELSTAIKGNAIRITDSSSSTSTIPLGGDLIVTGSGVGTSISGNVLNLSLSNITNANLSGSAGITNANLANSSFTLGNATATLGGTVASVGNLSLTGTSSFDSTASANKMRFNYANAGTRPNATNYSGMFVTTSNDAKAFYAESGSWIEIVTENTSIGVLSNVDITSNPPTDQQILRFKSSNGRFIPANQASARFEVTNSGSGWYNFDGDGFSSTQANPTLYLKKGMTYEITVDASGHPFWINTANAQGTGSQYNAGVTNNGTQVGVILFTPDMNAPATLHYNCQYHSGMNGVINIS